MLLPPDIARKRMPPAFHPAAGKTCKQVDLCEEAMEIWCGDYRRADADHDGIPCENICNSVNQVNEPRKKAGC